MAEESGADVALADVLRALRAELERVDGDGVRVDSATVDLDLVVEDRGGGDVALRVGTAPGGTKRGKGTRLSVTLRGADSPVADGVAPGEGTASPRAGAVTPAPAPAAGETGGSAAPQARQPGLVDVLADALRSIAESATGPGGATRPTWGGPTGGDGPRR